MQSIIPTQATITSTDPDPKAPGAALAVRRASGGYVVLDVVRGDRDGFLFLDPAARRALADALVVGLP